MRKFTSLFFVMLLLFSCKKEKIIEKPTTSVNQKKIEKWYNDSFKLSKSTPDSIALCVIKMEHAAKNEPKEYKAMVFFLKGIQNANNASYELAIKDYETALKLLKQSKSDTLIAKVHNGIGNVYKIKGDYSKAFENLYIALKIYEKHQDKVGICSVNTIFGEIYFQKDNVKLAKEHLSIALKTLENDKFNPAYLTAYHTFANVYGMTGDYENALKIDQEGIRITDSVKNLKMKTSFLDNKANCFFFTNQLDSAQFYYNECLKIDILGGNKKQIADTYCNLGSLFSVKKDFVKAEQLTLKSIEILKSIDAKPNLGKSYAVLSEMYIKQGKFKKASEIQSIQQANYKLMIAEKMEASAVEYKIVYETQKKIAEIKLLNQEGKIRNLKIKEQDFKITQKNHQITAFIILIFGLITIAYFWKKNQELKNQLIKEKIIWETGEHERLRIAKDIHDDLGSGLTKINFLSEIISQKTQHFPEIYSNSESVKETAKKLIENMRDLIWALNPDNTTIANLLARMREYATDYLEDYPIELHNIFPENLPQTPITKETNRELFMVVKESLNNIVKHSKATEVFFTVTITSNSLLLSIKDNGIGLNGETDKKGNGLLNMQSRLETIGGIFTFISKHNNGTEITISLPLQQIIKYS